MKPTPPAALLLAAALSLASLALVTPRARAEDAARAIAIAEDQRRPDGDLPRYLLSPDGAVRACAALALGRIQDSTSVPLLTPLVADHDAAARREAIFALGQIALAHPGSSTLTPARAPLERALAVADSFTQDLAIEALGKLGDKAATSRVSAFLGSDSALLRGDAALALWRLADTTALGPLLARLGDPDAGVRWRVTYALEKIVAPDRIVLRVAQHLDDPDALVRMFGARTLGRQKAVRGTAYVLQLLDDPDPNVVVNALRALQQISDSIGTYSLRVITKGLRHADPYVRVTAATVLADRFAWVRADSAYRKESVDSLTAHLRDSDAATRGACARALASVNHLSAAGARALLRDASPVARVLMVQALPLLGAREAMPLLLARLAPGTPLPERMAAAEALGALKSAEAVAPLRLALADTSMLFAASAAGALGDLGDTASANELVAAYSAHTLDAEADARIAIRDALRQLKGAAFADSLERAHPVPVPPADYAADFATPPSERGVVLHTSAGDIEWAFENQAAPQTVKNFVKLAARGYFDGTLLHRVVPNFVIQDGDPTGTGSGGPGYSIRCEYNHLRYEAGMVGMALSGKDTGGSQWFITHSPQMHLNGRYTIFAHVTRGMDVVHRAVQGDRVLKVELLR